MSTTVVKTAENAMIWRPLVEVPRMPTPSGLLYASTLGADRCSPAAAALRRFLATPTATQAVLLHSGGRPAKQFKPPVYVTLWS